MRRRPSSACWNLELDPYTTEVVYALGAALNWRGYRSADLYLYQSRAQAEREGAVVGPAARRALTDILRSCKRGIGPAQRCEGLVLELLPDPRTAQQLGQREALGLHGALLSWDPGGCSERLSSQMRNCAPYLSMNFSYPQPGRSR